MKIHDFGLWFYCDSSKKWSTTIRQVRSITDIYYDGVAVGYQDADFCFKPNYRSPIKLNKEFIWDGRCYLIGRPLSPHDFEVIPDRQDEEPE